MTRRSCSMCGAPLWDDTLCVTCDTMLDNHLAHRTLSFQLCRLDHAVRRLGAALLRALRS